MTTNTLAAPTPTVQENVSNTSAAVSGTVTVGSARTFTIAGYVNTSHGKVTTTVEQTVSFQNRQTFLINDSVYTQNLQQASMVNSKVITNAAGLVSEVDKQISYPFAFNLTDKFNPDGSISQPGYSTQTDAEQETDLVGGVLVYWNLVAEIIRSADTLQISSSFSITGRSDTSSSAEYVRKDSQGNCYSETLASADNALTGYQLGPLCPAGVNTAVRH